MSVYRPTGSKIFWMDFHFKGQRIRESTGQPGKTRAKETELKRKQGLRDGASGIRRPEAPRLFAVAAADWAEAKKPKWSPGTFVIAQNSLRHLAPFFGKKLVVDIEARDIGRYQRARQAEGAAGRTVNIEVGHLRSVLKWAGAWARIQPHVEMLPERQDVGHALTGEEETALLAECGKSRSRVLLPFVVLALETGARFGTLRRLQWANVDLEARSLTFGRDKTRAGSNRTIPLTPRAAETLAFWAESFPDRKPEHYAFPTEHYGGSGAGEVFGFTAPNVSGTDPTKPTGSIKSSWETARKLAGLPSFRLHDLRHSAASRMFAGRIPLPMIARILGWAPGTLGLMAARYGHFSVEEMREALASIVRPEPAAGTQSGEVAQGYPKKSPKSGVLGGGLVQ
ncbi:MAG: tyrosine-type recombinase/integrase [Bryobacteraceae bacterium]